MWTRQNPCLLLSIEHTATRFWQARLREHGERGVYHRHIDPDKSDEWLPMLKQFSPVFVTVRHPYRTALSWARKGKPVPELKERWRLLAEVIDKYVPSYLSVDSEAREVLLADVAIRYGVLVGHDDWRPVGAAPADPYIALNEAGEAFVQDELACHAEFWDRFYALST